MTGDNVFGVAVDVRSVSLVGLNFTVTVLAADENNRFPTLLDGDDAGVDMLLVRSPISIVPDEDEAVETVIVSEELDASVDETVLEGGTSGGSDSDDEPFLYVTATSMGSSTEPPLAVDSKGSVARVEFSLFMDVSVEKDVSSTSKEVVSSGVSESVDVDVMATLDCEVDLVEAIRVGTESAITVANEESAFSVVDVEPEGDSAGGAVEVVGVVLVEVEALVQYGKSMPGGHKKDSSLASTCAAPMIHNTDEENNIT